MFPFTFHIILHSKSTNLVLVLGDSVISTMRNQPTLRPIDRRTGPIRALSASIDSSSGSCTMPATLAMDKLKNLPCNDPRFLSSFPKLSSRHWLRNNEEAYCYDSDSSSCSSTTRGRRRFRKERPRISQSMRRPQTETCLNSMNLATAPYADGFDVEFHPERWSIVNGTPETLSINANASPTRAPRGCNDDDSISTLSSSDSAYDSSILGDQILLDD